MNPIIALFLCSVFVMVLLILDHGRSKALSIASWIPTIWILFCALKPLGVWFAPDDWVNLNITEGSSLDRRFLVIMEVIGLCILTRRRIDWQRFTRENRWLLLLFFYMLVSISWSDYPFISFKRWVKASGIIVMALVVLTGPSPYKEIESILRRTIYIIIPFSILLVKYYPQLGMKWGKWSGATVWVGATMSKNTLGMMCMISALFLIWMWAKRKKQTGPSSDKYEMMANIVILGITLWLLKGPAGAFSATSVVVLIIGLITLFMLRRLKTSVRLGVMACLFLLVTGLAYLFINPVEIIAPLVGRDANLSGRTDIIWEQLISVAMEHPVLGLGYGGYWIEPLQLNQRLTINQAHNGYLDIFLELGVVGLVLFAIAVVEFFRKAAYVFSFDMEMGSFFLTILIVSLIHNYTESSYLKTTAFIWNIFVMLSVVSTCVRRETSRLE